ncbi:MAG: amidase, partial [Actinomycetota bacterium]|nr:amidase [Actinomycetota bacterium]
AHGNDGGGSIRVPASACGLVGLKPTRGRVSTGPHAGEHRGGFAVDRALTRSVRDCALSLDILSRPWPGDPYSAAPPAVPWASSMQQEHGRLRIGVSTGRAHAECVDAVGAAARLLDQLGHELVPDAAPPDWYDPEVTDQTIVIRTIGMARELQGWSDAIGRPLTEDDVEQSNWWSGEIGRSLQGTMYVDAQHWLQSWGRRVAAFWGSHDLLLTPVLGAPPPKIGHLSDPVEGPARLRELIGFVDQANVSGQPAISVPTALSADGLPIGVQLVAATGREDLLLQVARQLEDAGAFIALPDLSDRW